MPDQQSSFSENAVNDAIEASQLKSQPNKGRELTFGEKAVGLTFNPGKDQFVDDIKRSYAATIDMLHSAREASTDKERSRMLSIAITETQTAQMWAVKAVTWQY